MSSGGPSNPSTTSAAKVPATPALSVRDSEGEPIKPYEARTAQPHDPSVPLASSQAISATQILRTIPMTQSAASMVGAGKVYSTHCSALDKLLDGGVKRGHILELSGPPGSGKEALAANVARSFCEAGARVLFVDMQNMTSPATLSRILRKSAQAAPDYAKHVEYLNIHTLQDCLIFLHNLLSYLQAHPGTGLLVLNSLSFVFQSQDMSLSARNNILEKVKQILTKACVSRGLTVVITSQLATKLLAADGSAANFDTGSRAVLVPQLGSAYLPSGRTSRVILVPQTRSSGVLRLLSSPSHVLGRRPEREEAFTKIGGAIQ